MDFQPGEIYKCSYWHYDENKRFASLVSIIDKFDASGETRYHFLSSMVAQPKEPVFFGAWRTNGPMILGTIQNFPQLPMIQKECC